MGAACSSPRMWSLFVTGTFNALMLVSLLRHFFQCFKNAVCTRVHCNWRTIAPENFSFFVKNEQRAFANAFAFAIRPIFFGTCPFGLNISHQRKMQMAVLRESGVAP